MTGFFKVLFAVVTVAGLCWNGTAVAQESGKQGFRDDVSFLKQHTKIVTLTDGTAAVAVAPAYQGRVMTCLLYTSPSPRDKRQSRMPSSA